MESAGVRYFRTRCFCIRNLTRSLHSLVRFLIRQQLARKYRTPALSMKYSVYITKREDVTEEGSCIKYSEENSVFGEVSY